MTSCLFKDYFSNCVNFLMPDFSGDIVLQELTNRWEELENHLTLTYQCFAGVGEPQ